MWGTWWVWDARLTSELVLLLMYLGLIALWQAVEDPGRGGARGGDPDAGRHGQPADHQILGRLVEHAAPGREHLPHRRPDHRRVDAGPLFVMMAAMTLLFVVLLLMAMRNEILRRRVRTLELSAAGGAA